MNNSSVPKVSVCMITYNHEEFIQKALDSVLRQKVDFDYEIVIGEDCSTDNTKSIISGYKSKYPSIIKTLFSQKNIGMKDNLLRTLKACTGVYVAMLEGDDYWTDELKLLKQVDFLEGHADFSICAHRYKVYDVDRKEYFDDAGALVFGSNSSDIEITLQNFFDPWLLLTLTVVFRRNLLDFHILSRYNYLRDVHLFYHLIERGRGICLNYFGGIYQHHGGGTWSKYNNSRKIEVKYNLFKEFYCFNRDQEIIVQNYLGATKYFILDNILHSKRIKYKLIKELFKEYSATADSLIDRQKLLLLIFYSYLKRNIKTVLLKDSV